MEETLKARELINKSDRIIFLVGAGLSAELGLGTYWSGDEPRYANSTSRFGYTELEHAIADLWNADTEAQVMFHTEKLRNVLETPINDENSSYMIIKEFLMRTDKEHFIVTSNVDGAFERAGFDENRIYEIHGSGLRSQCLAEPAAHGVFTTPDPYIDYPKCPTCDSLARPNILFFNDLHLNYEHIYAQQDKFDEFRHDENKGNTIVLEVGAGNTVPTIRNLSVIMNGRENLPVIRINPNHVEGVDGIAGLVPKSKTAPFISLLEPANQALRSLLN